MACPLLWTRLGILTNFVRADALIVLGQSEYSESSSPFIHQLQSGLNLGQVQGQHHCYSDAVPPQLSALSSAAWVLFLTATTGLAAVLVSPESEGQFSFSAGLWLMSLWLPVPHGPLVIMLTQPWAPPSLTLSPGAVSVPALGQEVH